MVHKLWGKSLKLDRSYEDLWTTLLASTALCVLAITGLGAFFTFAIFFAILILLKVILKCLVPYSSFPSFQKRVLTVMIRFQGMDISNREYPPGVLYMHEIVHPLRFFYKNIQRNICITSGLRMDIQAPTHKCGPPRKTSDCCNRGSKPEPQ